MAIKSEVGWTRKNEDGTKLEISARRFGREWIFFHQLKRGQDWEPIKAPPLEDWLELLDAVRRKAQRMLLRPEEPLFVAKQIRERFPDAKFE